MKIAIAVPMPDHVSDSFTKNLIQIITYTRSNVPDLEELVYINQKGVRTDKNRNVMIKECMEYGFDYILWLDADMVFPHDIIVSYLEARPFDVMGCVYFKRSYPHDPVMYVHGTNPLKPYKIVNPLEIVEGTVVEVDGVGFGGVMVNCDVYKAMGDDRYMVYGENFHLPYPTTEQATHDLVWCKKAQEHGFKIFVHTGVHAGHIKERIITIEDFKKARQDAMDAIPVVNVLIPTINMGKAKPIADLMKERAETKCKIIVEEDRDRIGWVAMINKMAKENPAEYFVYAADDAYPSRGWLRIAMETLYAKDAGLVGFNEGKYQENNAGFGLVKYEWIKGLYDGDILYPEYKSHYSEPELTMIAKQEGKFAYNPRASLTEIVFNKDGEGHINNNLDDKNLFNARRKVGFGGLVTDKTILESIN